MSIFKRFVLKYSLILNEKCFIKMEKNWVSWEKFLIFGTYGLVLIFFFALSFHDFSWKCPNHRFRSPGEPRAVIRECFSTGILLGDINDPVEALPECSPKDVEPGPEIYSIFLLLALLRPSPVQPAGVSMSTDLLSRCFRNFAEKPKLGQMPALSLVEGRSQLWKKGKH